MCLEEVHNEVELQMILTKCLFSLKMKNHMMNTIVKKK